MREFGSLEVLGVLGILGVLERVKVTKVRYSTVGVFGLEKGFWKVCMFIHYVHFIRMLAATLSVRSSACVFHRVRSKRRLFCIPAYLIQ